MGKSVYIIMVYLGGKRSLLEAVISEQENNCIFVVDIFSHAVIIF